MKRLIIASIIIFSAVSQSFAQPKQQMRPHQDGRTKADIEQFQMQLIIKQLEIEESKQEAFTEIYTQYSAEMEKLRPKRQRREDDEGEKPTDEQIEAQILESFEVAEQVPVIKRKYYQMFKRVLSPHQILRMYNIERQFTERINSELQNRAGRGER
ncbi:MAG: hypothetical protein SNG38_09180 [Rikenellaceae bacterium]